MIDIMIINYSWTPFISVYLSNAAVPSSQDMTQISASIIAVVVVGILVLTLMVGLAVLITAVYKRKTKERRYV